MAQADRCTMGVGCDEFGVCYAAAHKQPWRCPHTTDREAEGWLWLDEMVSAICAEHASDISYSADQMVDAYMAGAARATTPLEARIAALEGAMGEAVKQIETAERVMLWAEHRMACEDYAKVIANDARNIAETAASLRAMLADDGEE